MRTGFVVPSLFQTVFLGWSGRKLVSFLGFDFAKAAVFVGVGHWLHDTPPIFSDRIMRIVRVRSCVGIRTLEAIAEGRAGMSSGSNDRRHQVCSRG
jgi:hypothetical protein